MAVCNRCSVPGGSSSRRADALVNEAGTRRGLSVRYGPCARLDDHMPGRYASSGRRLTWVGGCTRVEAVLAQELVQSIVEETEQLFTRGPCRGENLHRGQQR